MDKLDYLLAYTFISTNFVYRLSNCAVDAVRIVKSVIGAEIRDSKYTNFVNC